MRKSTAAIDAVLFASVAFALDRLGSPAAWSVFWAVTAAQVGVASWLTWRRTGLTFMALGMAEATLFSVMTAFIVRAGGYGSLAALPLWWMMLALASGLHFSASVWLDFTSSPDRFRAFRAAVSRASYADLLLYRHIPNLR